MKMEIQQSKSNGAHQKQFSPYEGSLQWYRPTSGNKENLKQPNLVLKGTRKRKNKPKISRRKEIIKIRAEINDKEIKEASKS